MPLPAGALARAELLLRGGCSASCSGAVAHEASSRSPPTLLGAEARGGAAARSTGGRRALLCGLVAPPALALARQAAASTRTSPRPRSPCGNNKGRALKQGDGSVAAAATPRGAQLGLAACHTPQLGKHWVPPPTRVSAPGRVVAIGDLHGDLAQTLRALQLAGCIGLEGNRAVWTGGNTTLVQMGDILDRGDEEIGILFLLQRLAEGAEAAGGAVYVLNGNHEVLNVGGDFRYVTAGAFLESARFGQQLEKLFGTEQSAAAAAAAEAAAVPKPGESEQEAAERAMWLAAVRTRVGLFRRGGPLAQQLARNSTVLIVDDTVFVHGGLMPAHVQFGLERLNAGVSRWMLGDDSAAAREAIKVAAGAGNSMVWSRAFSREGEWKNPAERHRTCAVVARALQMAGASRMVVGHTPQLAGCNAECDGLVWRIDVGLSRGVIGAAPQVLEIVDGNVRVLAAPERPEDGAGAPEGAPEENWDESMPGATEEAAAAQ